MTTIARHKTGTQIAGARVGGRFKATEHTAAISPSASADEAAWERLGDAIIANIRRGYQEATIGRTYPDPDGHYLVIAKDDARKQVTLQRINKDSSSAGIEIVEFDWVF